MATEAPAADAQDAPKKGGKKLLIIILGVVVLLAAAGGGALFFMKKGSADEEEAEAGPAKSKKVAKRDPNAKPVFVPLDAFTVNLADREQDKFGQITLSLEVVDAKAGDTVKAYMPVIRNNILMVLSHKTAAELLDPEGKKRLSHELLVETARALGVDVPSAIKKPAAAAAAAKPKSADEDEEADDSEAMTPRRRMRAQMDALAASPVKAVHYISFIVQ